LHKDLPSVDVSFAQYIEPRKVIFFNLSKSFWEMRLCKSPNHSIALLDQLLAIWIKGEKDEGMRG
jgi:hypothetical protein